jgi:hypothetical protein
LVEKTIHHGVTLHAFHRNHERAGAPLSGDDHQFPVLDAELLSNVAAHCWLRLVARRLERSARNDEIM